MYPLNKSGYAWACIDLYPAPLGTKLGCASCSHYTYAYINYTCSIILIIFRELFCKLFWRQYKYVLLRLALPCMVTLFLLTWLCMHNSGSHNKLSPRSVYTGVPFCATYSKLMFACIMKVTAKCYIIL